MISSDPSAKSLEMKKTEDTVMVGDTVDLEFTITPTDQLTGISLGLPVMNLLRQWMVEQLQPSP